MVSGWASLSSEAKVALVEELLRVAALSGQVKDLKVSGRWGGGLGGCWQVERVADRVGSGRRGVDCLVLERW